MLFTFGSHLITVIAAFDEISYYKHSRGAVYSLAWGTQQKQGNEYS